MRKSERPFGRRLNFATSLRCRIDHRDCPGEFEIHPVDFPACSAFIDDHLVGRERATHGSAAPRAADQNRDGPGLLVGREIDVLRLAVDHQCAGQLVGAAIAGLNVVITASDAGAMALPEIFIFPLSCRSRKIVKGRLSTVDAIRTCSLGQFVTNETRCCWLCGSNYRLRDPEKMSPPPQGQCTDSLCGRSSCW